MHVESVVHVRDHSKATGPAHHMLEYITLHTNRYTGEALSSPSNVSPIACR